MFESHNLFNHVQWMFETYSRFDYIKWTWRY